MILNMFCCFRTVQEGVEGRVRACEAVFRIKANSDYAASSFVNKDNYCQCSLRFEWEKSISSFEFHARMIEYDNE